MSEPTFASLGASPDVVARLAARGIVDPFPIQAATVPDGLAGRDVCGRAPTGSGKTIAFGIPMVARVSRAKPRRPRGLVLVPTRELAEQVGEELRLLSGTKGPSVMTIYGGVGFGPQTNRLRRGVDIVVACPGRLADLLRQKQLTLEAVEFVVIDEADRMADMGFLPEVRRLLDTVPAKRQTLLFSATLDGDVDVLVKRYQRNPVRHELAADADEPQSEHVFRRTERADKVKVLARTLERQWPAIVFCRTKHGADRLAKQLGAAGITAAAIHGNRSQGQRSRALADFARGKVSALVATDVAARGIHVDDVAIVVHFDPPATDKDYVHRSGRTGRAGQTGVVLSLLDRDQHREARNMQRRLGLEVDEGDPQRVANTTVYGTDSGKASGPGAPSRARNHRRGPPRGPRR